MNERPRFECFKSNVVDSPSVYVKDNLKGVCVGEYRVSDFTKNLRRAQALVRKLEKENKVEAPRFLEMATYGHTKELCAEAKRLGDHAYQAVMDHYEDDVLPGARLYPANDAVRGAAEPRTLDGLVGGLNQEDKQ